MAKYTLTKKDAKTIADSYVNAPSINLLKHCLDKLGGLAYYNPRSTLHELVRIWRDEEYYGLIHNLCIELIYEWTEEKRKVDNLQDAFLPIVEACNEHIAKHSE